MQLFANLAGPSNGCIPIPRLKPSYNILIIQLKPSCNLYCGHRSEMNIFSLIPSRTAKKLAFFQLFPGNGQNHDWQAYPGTTLWYFKVTHNECIQSFKNVVKMCNVVTMIGTCPRSYFSSIYRRGLFLNKYSAGTMEYEYQRMWTPEPIISVSTYLST